MADKRIHTAIRKAGGSVNEDGSITFGNDDQFRAAVRHLHELLAKGRKPDPVAELVARYSNLEPLPDGKAIPNASEVRQIIREELERTRGVEAPMDADLKPCPFCGESLMRYEPRREGDSWYQHPTSDCVLSAVGLGDPFVVFESAGDFAKWNRRAAGVDEPRATPTVDAAFEMVDRLRERREIPSGVPGTFNDHQERPR